MKARIVLAVMLVAVFLLPGEMASAGRGGMRGVTGSINLEPPDWGDYFRVWIEFNVHQVNPSTDAAKGMIHARVYNPTLGWKRLWYDAKCVSFSEVGGKPAATVVAMIVRREGWDEGWNDTDPWYPGEPGEYLKWQLIDGGTPGRSVDVWMLEYYDYESFREYWPTYPDGGCTGFDGDETNNADHGNLVIH